VKNIGLPATLLALVVAGADVAEAQVFTPSYASPRSAGDYGLYVSSGPGDFAIEGVIRSDLGIHDAGFRGGVASADGALFLLGADLRSPFNIQDFPILFAFVAGVQSLFGQEDSPAFGGTVGSTVGYTFVPGDFSFTPYVHPRLGLLAGEGRDGIDAVFLADLGIDFTFAPGVVFRLSLGLGHETANWGLGVAWR
jgi:hypothetical protein